MIIIWKYPSFTMKNNRKLPRETILNTLPLKHTDDCSTRLCGCLYAIEYETELLKPLLRKSLTFYNYQVSDAD